MHRNNKRRYCWGLLSDAGVKAARIDLADVIAFGDDIGDLGMLKEAGVGVLMKNAKDHLKTEEYIISEFTNDEDGVARFLAKYFCLDA